MIFVDPRIRFNYATYYIKGIEEVTGQQVQFALDPFLDISCKNLTEYFSGVPIVVDGKRIFIDYCDYDYILDDRYNWCDVYAKVNCTDQQLQERQKLMAIGPGFGIQLYSPIKTLWIGWKNYSYCKKHFGIPFRRYLGDYTYSFVRRRKIEQYEKQDEKIDTNYVFHASILWNKRLQDRTTNAQRAAFLKVCKKAGMQVDGGLVYLEDSGGEMKNYAKYKSMYQGFLISKRVGPDDYIKKTKRSLCVFNAPSVGLCHGWKLAEYLCMGKAIISVPLTRALPAPLDCLLIVQNPQEIEHAVNEIHQTEGLRKEMEQSARHYYEKYLSPKAVIETVIKAAN